MILELEKAVAIAITIDLMAKKIYSEGVHALKTYVAEGLDPLVSSSIEEVSYALFDILKATPSQVCDVIDAFEKEGVFEHIRQHVRMVEGPDEIRIVPNRLRVPRDRMIEALSHSKVAQEIVLDEIDEIRKNNPSQVILKGVGGFSGGLTNLEDRQLLRFFLDVVEHSRQFALLDLLSRLTDDTDWGDEKETLLSVSLEG